MAAQADQACAAIVGRPEEILDQVDRMDDDEASPSTGRQWRSALLGVAIGLCLGGGVLWLIRSSRQAAPQPDPSGLVHDQTGRAFPAADLAALMRAAQAQTQPTSRSGGE